MLESGQSASAEVVNHLDSCLTCLSCTTTCPSGVDYRQLIDKARVHIEQTYKRPLGHRLNRAALKTLVPRPALFRLAIRVGQGVRLIAYLLPKSIRGWLGALPRRMPKSSDIGRPRVYPSQGPRRLRVALHTGCVQKVLRPQINQASIGLLTRHGCEVVVPKGLSCCGALVHHLGQQDHSIASAKANIDALMREVEGEGLDAIVINASGCGSHIKDYVHVLRQDPSLREAAEKVSALAVDISELYQQLQFDFPVLSNPSRVAYHAPCSLHHGQGIGDLPQQFLEQAGFDVVIPSETHLCCGSAGSYSLLQPEMAKTLGQRKISLLEETNPDFIATGNIGCLTHFEGASNTPIVHTVELLDWATGGPPVTRES
jgi:glycolate oxidase iron-sulfur subunit